VLEYPYRLLTAKPLTNLYAEILIVDDHTLIRHGMTQLLLNEYPDVLLKKPVMWNSPYKKVTANEFDIVICDLTMPGRTGQFGPNHKCFINSVRKYLDTDSPEILKIRSYQYMLIDAENRSTSKMHFKQR
jgi:DNA-binding NarL/FixJ family response regulator